MFLILLLIHFLFPPQTLAIDPQHAPINGTFLMLDFSYNTADEWDAYFNDLKGVGMDTVIPISMGVVNKSNNCSGEYTYESALDKSWFSEGVLEMVLKAAHKNNFNIYLGLSGNGSCIKPENSADSQEMIRYSKELIERVKTLSSQQGWNWDNGFIKGFYIPQELDIRKFTEWTAYFNHYKNTSNIIKSAYPNKKILLSPYLFEEDSYNTIYNNIKFAISNTSIDIFAPQDSVGTKKVTSYSSDRSHFQALSDAVKDANTSTGKSVQAWANIESFTCPSGCGNLVENPTNINTLSWQIRAVDDLVTQKITWLHQWSLATIALLNNYGYYTPDYAVSRLSLRNQYLTKPIVVAAFKWETNFVIKSYNVGPANSPVRVYIHYQNSIGQNLQTSFEATTKTTIDTGKNYSEIWYNFSSIPNIDLNKKHIIAIENKDNFVGYYYSQTPENSIENTFSEIIAFDASSSTPTPIPTLTLTPIPTLIKLRGDANGDSRIDINDSSIWRSEFIEGEFGTLEKTNWLADFDNDQRVTLNDISIWRENFIKTLF